MKAKKYVMRLIKNKPGDFAGWKKGGLRTPGEIS
jgi:hypothetical protein